MFFSLHQVLEDKDQLQCPFAFLIPRSEIYYLPQLWVRKTLLIVGGSHFGGSEERRLLHGEMPPVKRHKDFHGFVILKQDGRRLAGSPCSYSL